MIAHEKSATAGATAEGGDRRSDLETTPQERDFSTTTGVTARLLDVKPVGQELENWCWAASAQMMLGYLRSLGETECPTCGRSGSYDEDVTQAAQMNRRLGDSEVDCSVERTADFDYKACDRGGWPYFYEFEDRVQSTEWASKRHVLEERGLALRDGGPRLRVRGRLSERAVKALASNSGPEFRRRLQDAEGAALSWEKLTYLLDHQRPVAFAFRYPQPSAGHMRLAVGYAVTPGNKRWVAVADPLPPGTGEVHLIPYEFYRDGPFDGHWRDYWVLPAAEEGSTVPCPHRPQELAVGRELVASYIAYPTDPAPGKPEVHRGTKGLSEENSAKAFAEAKQGLRAVEAIALHAEPMALDLGMGAAWARARAKLISEAEQERAARNQGVASYQIAELERERAADRARFAIQDLKPGDLELRADDFVYVHELTVSQLQSWNAGRSSIEGLVRLLDRPRELIFAVTRPDQAPIRFFSAVTVRRKKDLWKVSSLGRASLTRFYLGKQLQRLLEEDRGGQAAGSAAPDRPKYLLSVPELYQLLVAYAPHHLATTADPHLEDEVFPVYQKSFHRPERCIKKGSLHEVLVDLQNVANQRDVLRGR